MAAFAGMRQAAAIPRNSFPRKWETSQYAALPPDLIPTQVGIQKGTVLCGFLLLQESGVWLISNIKGCGTIAGFFISEASCNYLFVNEVGEIQIGGFCP